MDWSALLNTVLRRLDLFVWLGWGLGGFLTFSPLSWLKKLGLVEFVSKWRPWISITFLICLSFLLYSVFQAIVKYIRKHQNQDQYKKKISSEYAALTPDERKIIRFVVQSRSDAVWLPYHDPSVMSLRAKGLLELVSNQLTFMKEWNYELCCLCRLSLELKMLLFPPSYLRDDTDRY